jgi:peroxiredoxin
MALEYSTASVPGSEAPSFSLRGVDGKMYGLESFIDRKGLLVVFMCNHCPYVIAVHERLSRLAREYAPRGIAVIGINSNDPLYKEADSFENMVRTAKEWNLPFPYVFDESQETAKAYDAVCTPDPYLYENVNGKFLLRYRGRIDDSWQDESKVKRQDLREAMETLVNGSARFDEKSVPSMGCSIKWKELTAAALERKKK